MEGKVVNNKPYFNHSSIYAPFGYVSQENNPNKDSNEIERHNSRNREHSKNIDPLARRQNSIDNFKEFGWSRTKLEDLPNTLEREMAFKHADGFGDKSWREYRKFLNRNRSGKDDDLGITQLMNGGKFA